MLKILLAVDGSTHALNAARTLVQAAPWFKEPPLVLLLSVHLPVPPVHGLARVVGRQALQRYYREESEAALAGSRKLIERARIPFKTVVVVGQVADSIVAEATARKCDMIYMGTRGLNAMSKVLLGSIATKVLHLSDLPVVLVR